MKTQEQIKEALENGLAVFEGKGFFEWRLPEGCKHHYNNGITCEWDKPFIDSVMNAEYISMHIFVRQNLFGPAIIA